MDDVRRAWIFTLNISLRIKSRSKYFTMNMNTRRVGMLNDIFSNPSSATLYDLFKRFIHRFYSTCFIDNVFKYLSNFRCWIFCLDTLQSLSLQYTIKQIGTLILLNSLNSPRSKRIVLKSKLYGHAN